MRYRPTQRLLDHRTQVALLKAAAQAVCHRRVPRSWVNDDGQCRKWRSGNGRRQRRQQQPMSITADENNNTELS